MRLRIIYIISIILLGVLGACVSKYEFEPQAQSFTVISGVITNSLGERTITVKQIESLDLRGEPIEASGRIYKNGELEVELVPVRVGELIAPLSFKVEENASYHIEVNANNQVFRSKPVVVAPKLTTDSLSFILEERIDRFTEFGIPIKQWYVDVLAHIQVAENRDINNFYKWHIDESWAVISNSGVCYVVEPVTENEVTIASSEDLQTGSISITIASIPLDQTFLEKHYINAYLHSLDKSLYDNYDKAQRLLEGDGTFFDEVPAPFSGNVFVEEGDKKAVLGIVEFSLADTVRLPIERKDIEVRIDDPCNSPFGCAGLGPCVCENCIAVYGPLSINKPFYWD